MNPVEIIALLALAMLEGSLVALPRAGAFASLARLRSPAWAAALPGLILAGTFIPLWCPRLVPAVVALSAVATPLLAVVAAAAVARGPRALVVAAIASAIAVALALGAGGSLAASLVTAFGCMSVGVALVRLIPRKWLIFAVIATASLDASLLVLHVGQPAAALVATATAHLDGRAFDQAAVGPITVDYPDLVLAAALGGFVAGEHRQQQVALRVTLLAAASGTLVGVIRIVPETVPIAIIFILVATSELRRSRVFMRLRSGAARGAANRGDRPAPATPG